MPGPHETSLHELIARRLRRSPQNASISHLARGVGDDAAVINPIRGSIAFCSDVVVENQHFRLEWSRPEDVARKALGSCLSDLAATNARPIAATISIGLPARWSEPERRDFIDRFYSEAGLLQDEWAFDVAGGDLTSIEGPLFVDVSAIGEAENPRSRAGARPGEWLAVTGCLGGAAAGLDALRSGRTRDASIASLIDRQLRPRPRFDIVMFGDLAFASATIDVSDGLASEARALALRSGLGVELEALRIPVAPETRAYGSKRGVDPLDWALGGGEDYELLAAFSPDAWAAAQTASPGFNDRWSIVGTCTSSGLWIRSSDGSRGPLPERGFDHFAR